MSASDRLRDALRLLAELLEIVDQRYLRLTPSELEVVEKVRSFLEHDSRR